MLLYGENARRVIQFLADVFDNALELAAACTFGVLRLVTNDGTWELGRQRRHPLVKKVGIEAVAQADICDGGARLGALLNGLGFEEV